MWIFYPCLQPFRCNSGDFLIFIYSEIANSRRQMRRSRILLVILWVFTASAVSAGGNERVPNTEETVTAALDQLMETWPAKAALKDLPANATDLPHRSDAEYIQDFRRMKSAVPFTFNPHVKEYIQLFTLGRRQDFEVIMGLSEYYFPQIEAQLRKMGLPEDLKYLPVALSALNPRSVGTDGTAGIWRLHYHTGLRYGLKIDEQYDERRDFEKSTTAALKYLKSLHDQFGTWDRAVAAYLGGPAGFRKAVVRAGSRDFWQQYEFLPSSNREVIPAWYAAAYVFGNAETHALNPAECPLPFKTETVTTEKPVEFAALSGMTKIPESQLRDFNPLFRAAKIPAGTVRVPEGKGEKVTALLDTLYKVAVKPAPAPVVAVEKSTHATSEAPEKVVPDNRTLLYYTIKSGDNLGSIAEWYDVGLSELKAWNGIRGHMIRAGDKLKVYVSPSAKTKLATVDKMTFEQKEAMVGKKVEPKPEPKPEKPLQPGEYEIYTVKSGDNLWAISRKYPGVSDKDIMAWNGITTDIKPGQKLKIRKQ